MGWHLYRRNHYNHHPGRRSYQWRWGGYRRIGLHLYQHRSLWRRYKGHWRRIRAYWHLWRRNHYRRRPRWWWGRYRRIGRHLYRMRILRRWDGRRWIRVRAYWHLWRKNHYKIGHYRRPRWKWGRFRRIGHHLYRLRTLYSRRRLYKIKGLKVSGHWSKWKRIRSYWHLWRRNHYFKKPRWGWGSYRRIGYH